MENGKAIDKYYLEHDFGQPDYTGLRILAIDEIASRFPTSSARPSAVHRDMDLKLLEMANAYLNTALDRIIPDVVQRWQNLDDFRNRCHRKKQHNQLVY